MPLARTFASTGRRALLCSLALHVAAASLVAMWIDRGTLGTGRSAAASPADDTRPTEIISISLRRAVAPTRVVRMRSVTLPARAPRTPVAAPARTRGLAGAAQAAPVPAITAMSAVVHQPSERADPAPRAEHSTPRLANAVAAPQSVVLPAAPTPEPSAAPALTAGAGGFAQNHPALFWDVHDVDDLRERLGGTAAIRVTIDDSGHALRVVFLTPVRDVALREEIFTRLMSARYIPAQCDGLTCTGELTFTT